MSAGRMVVPKRAEGSVRTKTYVNSFTGAAEGAGDLKPMPALRANPSVHGGSECFKNPSSLVTPHTNPAIPFLLYGRSDRRRLQSRAHEDRPRRRPAAGGLRGWPLRSPETAA